jgi:hypothetical protein
VAGDSVDKLIVLSVDKMLKKESDGRYWDNTPKFYGIPACRSESAMGRYFTASQYFRPKFSM